MAVKILDKEGKYSCTITGAQKTKKKQVLLTLKTNRGSTKLCLDTINRIDHQGLFSTILDMICFKGFIQKPEEVIGGCFQGYLKPHGDFSDIKWIGREAANVK